MSNNINLNDIDRESETSLTQQLVDRFSTAIDAGDLEPGTKLPTTRALAEQAGVNPLTAARVYRRLSELGYWLGEPDGSFGSLTQQAVYALQKAAGISRDGIVGPRTERALERGVRPKVTLSGDGVEIVLERQLRARIEDHQRFPFGDALRHFRRIDATRTVEPAQLQPLQRLCRDPEREHARVFD